MLLPWVRLHQSAESECEKCCGAVIARLRASSWRRFTSSPALAAVCSVAVGRIGP